jgi:hemerythrin
MHTEIYKQSLSVLVLLSLPCLVVKTGEATPLSTRPSLATSPSSGTTKITDNDLGGLDLDRYFRSACRNLGTPLARADAHLSAANWLLAVPASQSATRWLFGMDAPQDCRKIAQAGRLAKKHLREARNALKIARTKQTDQDEKQRRYELEITLDTLQPFADLWIAAHLKKSDKEYEETFRQAAYALAISREAEEAAMAAAARLWQAFSWRQIQELEQALRILPEVLAGPEFPTYGLAGRLIRCQLLAKKDQHAAALALAIRIGNLCQDWWTTIERPQQAAKARHLALRIQSDIARAWLQQIKQENSQQAKDLRKIVRTLQQRLEDHDEERTFTLPKAIPVIIHHEAIDNIIAGELSATRPARPTPSTQPASTRAVTRPSTTQISTSPAK